MSQQAWWHPEAFARRRPHLGERARLLRVVRDFFAQRDFVEVETPILQVSPGMETHIQAFRTTLDEPLAEGSAELWLHTSPEFAMKKLLVAGEPRLFQLARVFRNAERSERHHPEFTMLEWYRAGDGYEALMDDCAALLAACGPTYRRGDVTCDASQPPERVTVAEAFFLYAGIDLLVTMPDPWNPDRDALVAQARDAGLFVSDRDSWEDVFFRVMLDRIEPYLGFNRATILCEYPVSMAALSRPKPSDPRVAERFELYVCGVELANAFGELTDPAEQRRRFQADQDLKEKLYGVRHPIDEDFLAALEHGMPDSSGAALGFDRLVMLATGAETLDQVLWAPVAQSSST